MMRRVRDSGRTVTVTVAVAGATVLALGTPAVADEEGEEVVQPPGYVVPEVPEVDPEAAGLMLGGGATLAEPRVLDVKFISQSLDGATTDGGGETPGEDDTGSTEDPGDGQETNGGGEQREERTSGQHKFTLQTDVLFGRGSDEISGEAEEALADVAAAIEEYQPSQVNIFGFTDDIGSYESGVTLSENRARNTHLVLLELLPNADTIDFNVRGYSEDYPLYDNDTEEGRQQNRRVEISWPTAE